MAILEKAVDVKKEHEKRHEKKLVVDGFCLNLPAYAELARVMVMSGYRLPAKTYAPKGPYERKKYASKKCLRPGCENMTNHNGGYCSAECCKEDR